MPCRYWSKSILAHLHRGLALRIWRKLQEGGDVSLEKSLAAYDMFVLEDRAGDWDSVCRQASSDNVASSNIATGIGASGPACSRISDVTTQFL